MTVATPHSAPASAPGERAPRLLAVDALRAIAALSVLVHHLPNLYGPLRIFKPIQQIGYTGVGLFLVLSGFSIHYRWAATRYDHAARFDERRFWRRRFRRLYPSYISAVIFALVVAAILGAQVGHVEWAFGGITPRFAAILSTAALVATNIVPGTILTPVAWTLGLEVQLYAAYAVVVRRVRQFDPLRIVVGALIVTLVWRVGAQLITTSTPMGGFLPDGSTSVDSRFLYMQMPARCFEWFLGMLAAELYVRRTPLPRVARPLVVGLGTLLVAAVLARKPQIALTLNGHDFRATNVIDDQLFGLGFFLVLMWAVRHEAAWGERVTRALGALAYVGLFSYSIYLVHVPCLVLLAKVLPTDGTGGYVGLPVMFLGAVVLSWLFYLAVERRFVKARA